MKIIWTSSAKFDFGDICDYISERNPEAAYAIRARILDRVSKLADFPNTGRIGTLEGTRELVISGTAYIVVYRISDTAIEIVRVLHGARRWPPEFPKT